MGTIENELRRLLFKAIAAHEENMVCCKELERYRREHKRETPKSREYLNLCTKYHEKMRTYCDALAVMTGKPKGHYFQIVTNAYEDADHLDVDWMKKFCEGVPATVFER